MLVRYQALSLRAKFTIILMGVFITGMLIGGLVLYQISTQFAEDNITTRGEELLHTMNSVRTYTSEQVNPQLADRLQTDEQFIPETVPGYAARTVFENFRQDERYESFLYKEATLNPTNPRDLADDFEADLVNQFRADGDLTELNGYRTIDGERVFYIARPMRVGSESCLACHSTPDAAPASLINTYGDQGGFGWELNEIVAAQMIYVPSGDIVENTQDVFLIAMGIFTVIFGAVLVLINRLLSPTVLKPIAQISEMAEQISRGNEETREITLSELSARGDEVGSMARVFERMAENVRKRERELKTELQQLRVEIDHEKRREDVDRIADTEYFRALQDKAAQLRARMNPGTTES